MNPSRLTYEYTTTAHGVVYNEESRPVAALTAEERSPTTGDVRAELKFVGHDGWVKTKDITFSDWPPTEKDMEKLLVVIRLHGGKV